jgi:hypothetical protein
MADVAIPGYQAFWTEKQISVKSEHQVSANKFPETVSIIILLFKNLAGNTRASVDETVEWNDTVNNAQ